MKLNIKMLDKALRQLPPASPEYSPFTVLVENRLDNLRTSELRLDSSPQEDLVVNCTPVTFEAVKYCHHPNDCFYEWEMVTENE